MGKHTNDENVLKSIREGDQALIKKLHTQYWDSFCSYFLKNTNINKREVIKDFYSESFVILVSKITKGKLKLPLKSSLKTFLIGIGRNVLLRYYDQRKRNKEDSTDDISKVQKGYLDPDVETYYNNANNKHLVLRLLNKLGTDCQKILRLSFIEENADDAIAVKMGIPSTNGVRQKRFQCLDKLRKLIKKK